MRFNQVKKHQTRNNPKKRLRLVLGAEPNAITRLATEVNVMVTALAWVVLIMMVAIVAQMEVHTIHGEG